MFNTSQSSFLWVGMFRVSDRFVQLPTDATLADPMTVASVKVDELHPSHMLFDKQGAYFVQQYVRLYGR